VINILPDSSSLNTANLVEKEELSNRDPIYQTNEPIQNVLRQQAKPLETPDVQSSGLQEAQRKTTEKSRIIPFSSSILTSDQGICNVTRLSPWALAAVMYGGKG
jgi:hypothetical protein